MIRVACVLLTWFLICLLGTGYVLGQAEEKTNEETAKEEAKDGLVIEQLCDGFPGTKQKKKTRQRVIIQGDRIFMDNLDAPFMCIVRGDKKLIWEIDVKEQIYNERSFSYFKKIKKDKDTIRAQAVKDFSKIKDLQKRATEAAKIGILVGKDGSIAKEAVSRTEVTGEEKEINGFKCYRVKIYEDLRVVLDMWLTKKLESPKSLMDFYKKLGCFADTVVAEMEKIKDFPVVLNAELDFGSVTHRVECEIVKVEKKKIEDKRFELPKGPVLAKKITDKGVIYVQKRICPVCGKEVDPNAEATVRFVRKNVIYFFCNRECHQKFVKLLAKYKNISKVLQKLAEERKKNPGK